MKILKTMLGSDTDGSMFLCDTIEFEGGLWLVPRWLENLEESQKSPVRIVRMDTLEHQPMSPGFGADYLLNQPVPRAVLDGHASSVGTQSFEVVEMPAIYIPLPRRDRH